VDHEDADGDRVKAAEPSTVHDCLEGRAGVEHVGQGTALLIGFGSHPVVLEALPAQSLSVEVAREKLLKRGEARLSGVRPLGVDDREVAVKVDVIHGRGETGVEG